MFQVILPPRINQQFGKYLLQPPWCFCTHLPGTMKRYLDVANLPDTRAGSFSALQEMLAAFLPSAQQIHPMDPLVLLGGTDSCCGGRSEKQCVLQLLYICTCPCRKAVSHLRSILWPLALYSPFSLQMTSSNLLFHFLISNLNAKGQLLY